MKRYVVRNGDHFWAKESLRYHWSKKLSDARLYKTKGGARQVIDMLRHASMVNIGLAFPMEVVPVCKDRLGRVRRLSA